MSIDRNGIASDAFAITPSDAALAQARALYVGVTGNVAVVTEDGTAVTFPAVPAGRDLAVRVRQVLSTGTTAGGIVGYR